MRLNLKAGLVAAASALAALPLPAQAQTAGLACLQAATAAEREAGIPAGLLAAIGQIESGRRDPVTGRMLPWPWAINAQGAGRWFESAEDAARAVVALQSRGLRSIDMGCFQVNAQHHAAAFATLGEAFDPLSNARYAARFLTELRGRTGTWEAAVAAYHSSTPGVGDSYRDRVLAAWQGTPPAVVATAARAGATAAPSESAYCWQAAYGRSVRTSVGGPGAQVIAGAQLAMPTSDPRVVLIAGPGIRITGPARVLGAQAGGAAGGFGVQYAGEMAAMPGRTALTLR